MQQTVKAKEAQNVSINLKKQQNLLLPIKKNVF